MVKGGAGRFLAMGLVGVAGVALESHAANPGPRAELPNHAVVKACLRRIDEPDPAKFFSKNLEWELTCPLDDLRTRVMAKDSISWPAHVQLLVAHELYEEYLKFRANFFIQVAEDKRFDSPEGFFWSPLLENRNKLQESTSTSSTLGPIETPQAAFTAASAQWIEGFRRLLEAQLDSKGMYFKEAALLWVQILGSSGDIAALSAELEGRLSSVMAVSSDRDFVLRTLFEFSSRRAADAAILKPFLLKSLSYLKTLPRRNLESEHLELWAQYLLLQGDPESRIERDQTLKVLRELWILFPLQSHKVRIRKLAIDLGVSQSFIGPSERQMKIDELLLHADRQVRLLAGNDALKSLSQVLRLPSQQYTSKELWTSLELHIRLLRILDQRPQIPALLSRYVTKGYFLDIPKKPEREEFFSRLYQIGRWQWSYDTSAKALATFDRIISLNRAWGTDFQLGTSYYIRARIMEQSGDRKVARLYFEEAIQELRQRARKNSDLFEDLLWRRFYNEYDQASENRNYKTLVELIEEIKPFVLWDEDGDRWLFWRAMANLSAGSEDKAIAYLREAYLKTPLSYYSVMAGLELVRLDKKPSGWALPDATSFWISEDLWEQPSFSDFFDTKTLKVSDSANLPWAQVYGLASIGRFGDAKRYITALERRLYALAGRKAAGLSARRKALRRGAWLRLATGDSLGSLRMGELARITFEGDLEAEELAYLYPLPFKQLINEAAAARKIDPWHAISLIRQESAFNPQARSSANALGLMQIIPPVAEQDAKKLGIKGFRPEHLLDPTTAVHMGSFHLSELFIHFESSVIASTAGYNAGRPPVYSWIRHYSHPLAYVFIERISFAETRKYVRSILRNYVNYARIYGEAKVDTDALLKMPVLMPGATVGEEPQDIL